MTSGGTLRVLVVDDNRDTADSLSLLVKLWRYEVQTAYDETALALAATFRPDVIVLDIGMPRMDGNAMMRHFRAQDDLKNALILAVSGYQDEVRQQLAREAGADHYLIKPVDPNVLEQLLQAQRVARQTATPDTPPEV